MTSIVSLSINPATSGAALESQICAEHADMLQDFWKHCDPEVASIDDLQNSLHAVTHATTALFQSPSGERADLVLPNGKRFMLRDLLEKFNELKSSDSLCLESRYLVRKIALKLVKLDRKSGCSEGRARIYIHNNARTVYRFSEQTFDALVNARPSIKRPTANSLPSLGNALWRWEDTTPPLDGALSDTDGTIFLADGTVNRVIEDELEAGLKALIFNMKKVPKIRHFPPGLIPMIIQYISLFVFVPPPTKHIFRLKA